MPKTINATGRPRTPPPKGFLTLQDAAKRRGVSYSTAYRFARAELVRTHRVGSGTTFVDERDLPKIVKHEPPDDRARIAVQLRANPDRYALWAAAADAAGLDVTTWIYGVADRAAARSR